MAKTAIVKITQTVPNSANPRSKYDVALLAQLTLSMYSKGWDADNMMLVSEQSDDGTYTIQRGHRRRKCWLMSLMLRDTYPPSADGVSDGVAIEDVTKQWEDMIEECGSPDEVESELNFMYGNEEIEVVISSLTGKDAYFQMIGDGAGSEEYDVLGIVTSLRHGVNEFGVTYREIAAVFAKSQDWARNMVNLAKMDENIVERVASGTLTVRAGTLLMKLTPTRRDAMASVMMSVPAKDFRLKTLDDAVKALVDWELRLPLDYRNQQQRNIARAFDQAWADAIKKNAAEAWRFVSVIAWLKGSIPDPWANRQSAELWLNTMGIGERERGWKVRLYEFLTAVNCETCALNNLPKEQLREDLQLPCRRAGSAVERCFSGLSGNDPFNVSVPASWAGHAQGKLMVSNGKVKASKYDDLLEAWHQQRDIETKQAQAEAAAEAALSMIDETPAPPAPTPKPTPATSVKPAPAAPAAPRAAATSTPAAPPAPPAPRKDRPIDIQRKKIKAYVDLQAMMPLRNHPMAGGCDKCQHRMDNPPAKGKGVPLCAWASGSHDVEFGALKGKDGRYIPVCSQYQPASDWESIIPSSSVADWMTREWLVASIEATVLSSPSYTGGYSKPMQFLLGRAINRNLPASDFEFIDRLKKTAGDLTEGQLATLLMWATTELRRYSSTVRNRTGNSNLLIQINGVMTECVVVEFSKIDAKAVKKAAKKAKK